MRRSDEPRIAFLLSLATFPLAACPSDDGDASGSDDTTGADDDDDDDDDDDSVSASMTAPDPDSSSSGAGTTTTDPTTESSGPESTESTGSESTTSTESSGSASSSSSESGSTTGLGDTESESDTDATATGGLGPCPDDVDIPDICSTYEDNFIGCYPEYAGYPVAFNCACNLLYSAPNYSGQDCVDAFEDYYACLGTTPCGQIMGECADEAEALAEPCSS